MYESFYQLSADPFRLSPDSGFSFEHRTYRKAMIYMRHALQRAEGFIMITGQPGTGKTTLVNDLVGTIKPEEIAVSRIVSTQLTANDLLDLVAHSFKLDFDGCSKAKILIQLEIFLKREHMRGRRALLIIDEAQCMRSDVLEEVRLLTNIMVGNHQLLQVFLVGQEQLRETVNAPVLEQLHQRLIAATHLEPLDTDDTRAYIKHRLHCVNWTGDPLISTETYDWIQQYSRGIPRQINQICSRLFLHGCVEEKHRLGLQDLKAVIDELRQEMLLPLGSEGIAEIGPSPAGLLDETFEDEPQASPPVPQPAPIATEILPVATTAGQNQPVPAIDAEQDMPDGEPVAVVESSPPAGSKHADTRHRESRERQDDPVSPAALQDQIPEVACLPQGRAGISGRLVVWGGVIIVLVLLASVATLRITRHNSDQSASYQDVSAINLPGAQQFVRSATEVSTPVPDQSPVASPVPEALADDVARITASESDNAVGVAGVVITESSGQDNTDPAGAAVSVITVNEADATIAFPDVVIDDIPGQEKPDQAETAAQAASVVGQSAVNQVAENAKPVPVGMTAGASPFPEEKVAELLLQATSSLEDDRLLIPGDNSAYFYFSQVLKLNPGNSDALHGIGEIVARYTALATAAFEESDNLAAARYVMRGLSVHPYHVDLLVLRDRLNAYQGNMSAMPASGQQPVNYSSRSRGFQPRH